MLHAYEAFQIEVGLYGNILSAAYTSAGCLATDGTWFKNLWEFANEAGVTVELPQAAHFEPIRENDRSLMEWLMQDGLPSMVIERLNWIWKYKGIVHVSDEATCDGIYLDQTILTDETGDGSSITFPLERPTRADFRLWGDHIRSITGPSLRLLAPLGLFLRKGHRTRRWRVNFDNSEIYYWYERDGVIQHDVYACAASLSRNARQNSRRAPGSIKGIRI